MLRSRWTTSDAARNVIYAVGGDQYDSDGVSGTKAAIADCAMIVKTEERTIWAKKNLQEVLDSVKVGTTPGSLQRRVCMHAMHLHLLFTFARCVLQPFTSPLSQQPCMTLVANDALGKSSGETGIHCKTKDKTCDRKYAD